MTGPRKIRTSDAGLGVVVTATLLLTVFLLLAFYVHRDAAFGFFALILLVWGALYGFYWIKIRNNAYLACVYYFVTSSLFIASFPLGLVRPGLIIHPLFQS